MVADIDRDDGWGDWFENITFNFCDDCNDHTNCNSCEDYIDWANYHPKID